jgi:hypothetical protein
MALAVVDCRPADPSDFRMEFIHRYPLPTAISAWEALQRPGLLRNLPD